MHITRRSFFVSMLLAAAWFTLPMGTHADTEVSCQNDAGSCTVSSTGGQCKCADGSGIGYSESSEGGDLPTMTEEELRERCNADLVETCGTEAPDINDYCTEPQLETCSEVVPILVAASEKCGSGDGVETNDPTEASDAQDDPHAPPPATPEEFSALAGCCELVSEDPEAFQEFVECLNDAGEDCAAMEACFETLHGEEMGGGDYESTEKDAADDRLDGENTEDSDQKSSSSGCSLAAVGRSLGWSLLTVLFDLF